MTVREFAESRYKSRQSIYQLAKNAGYKLSDYTDDKGNLSEEGIALLESLFPEVPEEPKEPEPDPGASTPKDDSFIEHLKSENQYLHDVIDRLQVSLDKAQDNLTREMAVTAHLRLENAELIKRLGSGEAGTDEPIQIDPVGESESKEEMTDPPAEPVEEPEKKTEPAPDQPEEPGRDPKPEGPKEPEKAGESSSPVTESEEKKSEPKKLSFGKRLRILFTGKDTP